MQFTTDTRKKGYGKRRQRKNICEKKSSLLEVKLELQQVFTNMPLHMAEGSLASMNMLVIVNPWVYVSSSTSYPQALLTDPDVRSSCI
eukprot:c7226_g1_i1 orf=24-287(+)